MYTTFNVAGAPLQLRATSIQPAARRINAQQPMHFGDAPKDSLNLTQLALRQQRAFAPQSVKANVHAVRFGVGVYKDDDGYYTLDGTNTKRAIEWDPETRAHYYVGRGADGVKGAFNLSAEDSRRYTEALAADQEKADLDALQVDDKGIYLQSGKKKLGIKYDEEAGRNYAGNQFLTAAQERKYAQLLSQQARHKTEESGPSEKKKKGGWGLAGELLKEVVGGGAKGAAEGIVKDKSTHLMRRVAPESRHKHTRGANYGLLPEGRDYPQDLEFDDGPTLPGRIEDRLARLGYESDSHSSNDNGRARDRHIAYDADGEPVSGRVTFENKTRRHL